MGNSKLELPSEILLPSHDSGLEKRLLRNMKQLSTDKISKEDIIFDDQVRDILMQYAWRPQDVQSVNQYLDNLYDPEGRPFGRSLFISDDFARRLANFEDEEVSYHGWTSDYKAGKQKVLSRYSKAKLHTLKYTCDQDIWEAVSDWSTSAGWDGYQFNGKNHKEDFRDNVFHNWYLRTEEAIREGSYRCPIIMASRSQASGEFTNDGERTNTCKLKTRGVMMYGLYQVISERIWAKPLSEWYVNYPYVGHGKSQEWISDWITRNRGMRRCHIATDFSKFDSTIPSWLIKDAFWILGNAFVDTDWNLLRVLEHDFIHKVVLTPQGFKKFDHGNPSGSGLTSIINDICNELITETWCSHFEYDLSYNVTGDDFVGFVRGGRKGYVSLVAEKESIFSYIKQNFGITVDPDSEVLEYTEPPEYLSCRYTDFGPYRHPNILISKLLYPERFRDYSQHIDSEGNVYYKSKPEIVLLSYIMAYPAGMAELMNISKFLRNYDDLISSLGKIGEAGLKALPYNVRQKVKERYLSSNVAC